MFTAGSYAACLKPYTLKLRTEIQVNGQRQPITKPLNSSCQTSLNMYEGYRAVPSFSISNFL